MRKKRIIVSVTNDLYTDQRVNKVCTFLVNEGFDVLLVGRLRKQSSALPKRSYRMKRMRLLFDKGALFYAEYNFRLWLFLLVRRTDVLLANDLDTLLANYLAALCKRRASLVYDSHEYFTEVPELQGRFAKKVWEWIEGWIFPKLRYIYTVNKSIADLYQQKYHKTLAVVRNVSPKWEAQNLLSKSELDIPEDRFLIIIQGAGINIDRGAEEAVEAMKYLQGACLLIVGDGDVVPQLKEQVSRENLQDSVRFFGKQPYQRMMNYTFHADIGLTLDKDTNINYRYSLPNKVFDYIHASTPIVCTNLVEVARVVTANNVGVVIDKLTPQLLAETIQTLQQNPTLIANFKKQCILAAKNENWQHESEVLKQIYKQL